MAAALSSPPAWGSPPAPPPRTNTGSLPPVFGGLLSTLQNISGAFHAPRPNQGDLPLRGGAPPGPSALGEEDGGEEGIGERDLQQHHPDGHEQGCQGAGRRHCNRGDGVTPATGTPLPPRPLQGRGGARSGGVPKTSGPTGSPPGPPVGFCQPHVSPRHLLSPSRCPREQAGSDPPSPSSPQRWSFIPSSPAPRHCGDPPRPPHGPSQEPCRVSSPATDVPATAGPGDSPAVLPGHGSAAPSLPVG